MLKSTDPDSRHDHIIGLPENGMNSSASKLCQALVVFPVSEKQPFSLILAIESL